MLKKTKYTKIVFLSLLTILTTMAVLHVNYLTNKKFLNSQNIAHVFLNNLKSVYKDFEVTEIHLSSNDNTTQNVKVFCGFNDDIFLLYTQFDKPFSKAKYVIMSDNIYDKFNKTSLPLFNETGFLEICHASKECKFFQSNNKLHVSNFNYQRNLSNKLFTIREKKRLEYMTKLPIFLIDNKNSIITFNTETCFG